MFLCIMGRYASCMRTTVSPRPGRREGHRGPPPESRGSGCRRGGQRARPSRLSLEGHDAVQPFRQTASRWVRHECPWTSRPSSSSRRVPPVIVDANLLPYARNADPPHHAASAWLEAALNGPTRVGLPWWDADGVRPHRHEPSCVSHPTLARRGRRSGRRLVGRLSLAWLAQPSKQYREGVHRSCGPTRFQSARDRRPTSRRWPSTTACHVMSTDSDSPGSPASRVVNPLA